jgi:N6-L-threonylcarbamoyladenine synthase
MNILGIDTSCDDTAAAVVEDGTRVLSNIVNSQIRLHHPYGGVVPELASREHLRNIVPVVDQALSSVNLSARDLHGIAVTVGPGLIGSLLVGLYFSKAFGYAKKIPCVGINHLEGHILSIFLEEDTPSFPFVALTVSGGHTSLYFVEGIGRYRLMGRTLDDAAGEAFDKVAKVLGLGYPGGVAIEKASSSGDKTKIRFPRAHLAPNSLDFSFSGIKTSVALYIKKWQEKGGEAGGVTLSDIAASFQEAVVDILVDKVMRAAQTAGVASVVMAGGVACNRALRQALKQAAETKSVKVHYPRPSYCTDNGAMIALAGYHRIARGAQTELDMDVRSRFPIDELAPL